MGGGEDGSGKCPTELAIVVFPQIEIDAATIVWSPVLVGANPDCHREVSAFPSAFLNDFVCKRHNICTFRGYSLVAKLWNSGAQQGGCVSDLSSPGFSRPHLWIAEVTASKVCPEECESWSLLHCSVVPRLWLYTELT